MNNDLISREALRKAIENYLAKRQDVIIWETDMFNMLDNAPTVEQKYYERIIAQINPVIEERPHGEWIDANKQIPEDCIIVLIWFEYYRYGDYNCMYQTFGLGYTIDGKWSPFINGETGWQDYKIIAWQPLPEPYKKGGAE